MIISASFQDQNPRLRVAAVVVGGGLLILLVALFRVQVLQGGQYGSREQAQLLRRIRTPSARGEIVDRAGVVLANNRPSYDIAIYLGQIKRQNIPYLAVTNILAASRVLGLPVPVTDREINQHYATRRPLPMTLWRDVTKDQMAAFVEHSSTLTNLDLVVTPVRQYPHGTFAAHVLGYCGHAEQTDEEEIEDFYYYQPDMVGKQGVEAAFDGDLHGAPGGRTIRVNPGGVKVGDDVSVVEAERGNRIVLTIDSRIQRITEQALEHTVLSAGKELRGCAVVLDPNSGEVLAMASLPDFDPNIFTPGAPAAAVAQAFQNPGSPMLNRAARALYPPGSTFKPITLLAGLESGAISPGDTAVCTGGLKIGNRIFGCWKKDGHGRVDSYMAILESCDVWFYVEGMKTGVDAIARMAAQFGLGRSAGLDFTHDFAGVVPTPSWKRATINEHWWDGDTAQLSIGQSFLVVTPLQMANVAATFANGGTRWRPFVVKSIVSPTGEVLQQTVPAVLQQLNANPDNIAVVRHAMLGAIEAAEGGGRAARVDGLQVAGKTGTAEFDLHEGNTSRRINRTWFIGFAPYNKPEIAVAVLIEDGNSGGHTAAPVAGHILAGIFNRTIGGAGNVGYAD
jgi:penicillin-binding protein 2